MSVSYPRDLALNQTVAYRPKAVCRDCTENRRQPPPVACQRNFTSRFCVARFGGRTIGRTLRPVQLSRRGTMRRPSCRPAAAISPASSSVVAACEAVRLVTPRARAISARVRGPSPASSSQASWARDERLVSPAKEGCKQHKLRKNNQIHQRYRSIQ